MSDLADAANDLALLLEAAAPRLGLRHASHARVIAPARRKVERVLREYFRRQEAAVLHEVKPKIVVVESDFRSSVVRSSKPVSSTEGTADVIGRDIRQRAQEASSGGNIYAAHILPSSIHPLRFPVTQTESSEFADAIASAIRGAAASIAAGSVIVDDVASRYLRDNSLTRLTGDFSATSVNRLRDAIAEAWDAGGSYNQIVAAIQSTFGDFSDTRAGMIAQTEVNDAYNRGRLSIAIEAGFDQKAWDPDGEACPICLDNVDAGWIGIDDDFPSGDAAPTAHPNCDCSIDFQKGAE